MAIERVEILRVRWKRGESWIGRSPWVRIWDDSGAYGLGEASPMYGGEASLCIVEQAMAPQIVGRSAMDCVVIHDQLFHQAIKLGPDGALAGALAAVDIALWDLKGKLLGQPVSSLLGGAWRTRLPWYASIGGNAHRDVDAVCALVERWLARKPAMIKIRFDGDKTTRDVDLEGDIAKAEAVRRLVGDGFPLAFDANNNYSVQGAIRVGRALESLGYSWFEEPVQSYHHEALSKVTAALDIAVSAGEQEYTLQGVNRLIDAGVSIVQPDIVKTGGFTGLSRMAAVAACRGVDLVPHQTQPAVGLTANLHFCASLLHGHYPCEYSELETVQGDVFAVIPEPKDGVFTLPSGPGLGLTLDEDALRAHLV